MGSIYWRGGVRWISYYQNGKHIRESSGSDKRGVAQQLLKSREGEVADGKVPSVYFEKVTFDELASAFLQDYQLNKRKSLAKAKRSVARLKKTFGGLRAPAITSTRITNFITERLKEDGGRANATINRELAALKRILYLGAEQTPPQVDKNKIPTIKMLKENNVRKGFFEHPQFLALQEALPEYLTLFTAFAYTYGWRDAEIRGILLPQVDLINGIVRLEVGESKNDEGRTVYLTPDLHERFKEHYERHLQIEKAQGKILPWFFLNDKGTGPIKDFRRAWETSCNEAGAPGKLFHDLRRTAVRNMVRAGIPERVAMKISGHKTRSVFDRYDIGTDADLQLASQQASSYLSQQEHRQDMHNLCTVTKISRKKGKAVNA